MASTSSHIRITADIETGRRLTNEYVATLIALLVDRGHSEFEAAEHVIAIGVPAHVAYDRAAAHIANR